MGRLRSMILKYSFKYSQTQIIRYKAAFLQCSGSLASFTHTMKIHNQQGHLLNFNNDVVQLQY